jgi:hypothetical protein
MSKHDNIRITAISIVIVVALYFLFSQLSQYIINNIPAKSVLLEKPFVLEVGEFVYIDKTRLTLYEITEDTRCPVDVECLNAGTISVKLTSNEPENMEIIELSWGDTSLFTQYGISMSDVTPAPVDLKNPIDQKDYEIQFIITQPTVTTFKECLTLANPIIESYPRKCRAGGITFVEDTDNILD